jgi:hypothetical protein
MTALPLRHRPRLGSSWTDLLVVVACCVAFAAVIGVAKRAAPKHPPLGGIAQELGTSPDRMSHFASLAQLDLRQQ